MKLIAEIGSVHDGSFGNAKKAVQLAAMCGADVVKFQTHIASAETTRNAPQPGYFKDEQRYDYFDRTAFSVSQWRELKLFCDENTIEFMSSPFSEEAFHILEEIGVTSYKIASGEITNTRLLSLVGKSGKTVYLSTGMSDWNEICTALDLLEGAPVVLMQCSSIYPCPPEKVGINVISQFIKRYGSKYSYGFSDHTSGYAASVCAVTVGADYIEKHLTFSKYMYGSDAKNSFEPQEFSLLSRILKEAVIIRDSIVDKNDLEPYKEMRHIFQKSIYLKQPASAGTVITDDMLTYKKPASGLRPADSCMAIGKALVRDLGTEEALQLEHLS